MIVTLYNVHVKLPLGRCHEYSLVDLELPKGSVLFRTKTLLLYALYLHPFPTTLSAYTLFGSSFLRLKDRRRAYVGSRPRLPEETRQEPKGTIKWVINRRVSAVVMKGLHDSGGRPVSEDGTSTTALATNRVVVMAETRTISTQRDIPRTFEV